MGKNRVNRGARLLRGIAIILMGITVVFTLLGGAGTTCVAFGAENFDSMVPLVPYKPLYLALVVSSLAVGIWGIAVLVALVRGGQTAYRNALFVLILGALTSGIQMAVSQSVRGSSAPVNMRFYVTLLTLVVFLLLRLPPLRERFDFSQPMKDQDSEGISAAAALIVAGAITLSVPMWAGPTHISSSGSNWVLLLATPLEVIGWALVIAGGVALVWASRVLAPDKRPQGHRRPGATDLSF